jgi:hypothetical protein
MFEPLIFNAQQSPTMKAAFTMDRQNHNLGLLLVLATSLFAFSTTCSIAQTTLLTESFETDGEGSRYTSNSFYNSTVDFFTRMDNDPVTYAVGNNAGVHPTNPNGSFYWGAEDCDVASGGEGVITLNALAATGYNLDVTVSLANSRPNDGRLEPLDYFILEYNLDGSGWNIFGALYGNNGTGSGNLQVDADLNGSPDPAGAEVNSSNFQDFNFSIPTTGNSLQLRLRVLANTGSESIIFDNIRISGTSSVPSPGAWDGSTSTDWNVASNWTGNVVPTASDNITIPSAPSNQPHVTLNPGTPAVCADLTIDAGATLTIDAGKALTVSGTLANAGTVDIKATASGIGSLITNGTVSGAGSFKMEQYLTGSGGGTPDGVFYYVSSPISDATAADYNVASGNKLWIDQEATQDYAQLTFGAIGLDVGQGYVARMGATGAITFDGSSYNTGNITEGSLSRTGTTELNRGYNLVGNPYPSTVNWDDLSRTNLETTMWYRTNNGGTMTFDTYNSTGQVGTNNNGGGTVDGTIPPTQAFWVRVDADGNTGSVAFENADRTHGTLSSIYKAESEEGTVRLSLSNGTASDEQVIYFDASANDAIDDHDSRKFWASGIPQLYTNINDDTLTINGLNSPQTTQMVPLGMKVPSQGNYSLNATSITLTETPAFLEDTYLNNFQDLNTNPNYSFTSDAGNIGDRFILHFNNAAVGIEEVESSSHVFASNGQLNISLSLNRQTANVEVFDMAGRSILNRPINASNTVVDLNAPTGIYLVRIETATGVKTHKVALQ